MKAGRRLAPSHAERIALRQAWARSMDAAWREAERQMDERCMAAVAHLSEKEFDRLFEEEEAEVEAIRAQIVAVVERDVWPAHLYWTGI